MLKIEAKSFRDARQDIVRVQKVIWDHLLAFKGEIILKQALFSLRKIYIYFIIIIYERDDIKCFINNNNNK